MNGTPAKMRNTVDDEEIIEDQSDDADGNEKAREMRTGTRQRLDRMGSTIDIGEHKSEHQEKENVKEVPSQAKRRREMHANERIRLIVLAERRCNG